MIDVDKIIRLLQIEIASTKRSDGFYLKREIKEINKIITSLDIPETDKNKLTQYFFPGRQQ